MNALLEIADLTIGFRNNDEQVQVVHRVGLNVSKGQILGLVGESGSGKSLTCLAVMRLLAANATCAGSIRYAGNEILSLPIGKMPAIRGREIAMIFQDPIGALNPVQTIGRQMVEAIQTNAADPLSQSRAREIAVAHLSEVGIPDPADRMTKYPHELSGGQNQRVMIAMMLAGNPQLLIADEPTTALDVTVQAQILRLLKRLREQRGTAIILVTHDLGVVAETCDQMAVMYCGRIVESGDVHSIFSRPAHPYTHGLLMSRPRVDQKVRALTPVKGVVPMPSDLPGGCAFEPRCPNRTEQCVTDTPEICMLPDGRQLACFHPRVFEDREA